MIILGIDPGLADLGYGVIEEAAAPGRGRTLRHLAHGVIRTRAGEPTAKRLDQIYRGLSEVIERWKPDAAAVEELFFAANMKTAIAVAQARGAAILATALAGIPLGEYSPPQIKLAIAGTGRASKRQVQMMVKAVLAMPEMPEPDHAADGLAAAICHAHMAKSPITKARRASRAAAAGGGAEEESNPNKALLAMARGKRRGRR